MSWAGRSEVSVDQSALDLWRRFLWNVRYVDLKEAGDSLLLYWICSDSAVVCGVALGAGRNMAGFMEMYHLSA